MKGEVRQAISVVKKRGGAQRSIREFRMQQGGISVGQPLRDSAGCSPACRFSIRGPLRREREAS